MKEFNTLVKDIKNKQTLPVYFLHGEEPFYIDQISDLIENSVLLEEEKAFNQTIVYASETDLMQLSSLCKEFPLGSEKKVIIVKEAQGFKEAQWEKLESYIEKVQTTTILVINYKYKKLDKRKKLYKLLDKNKWIFESSKLYDNQVPAWISTQCKELHLQIDDKSIVMLSEFLGTDLAKIHNELKKLEIIVSDSKKITPEVIEKNIGISKDYNVFELNKALGKRDLIKSYKIVNYLINNEKDNPLVMMLPQIFGYFSNLMLIYCLTDKSKMAVATALKVNPFFVEDYLNAVKNYKLKELTKIFEFIQETDLKSKGVGNTGTFSNGDLLKELIYKILNYRV